MREKDSERSFQSRSSKIVEGIKRISRVQSQILRGMSGEEEEKYREEINEESESLLHGELGEAEIGEKLSVTDAVFNLIKGFAIVGVLFLPSGFAKGGWFMGIVLMTATAVLATIGFILLWKTRMAFPGTYPSIGKKAYGIKMQYLVIACLTIFQVFLSHSLIHSNLKDWVLLWTASLCSPHY